MKSCLQIWMWWYPVSSPGHHSSPALCRWEPELSFLMLPAGLRLAIPAVCVYTCTQLQVIFWESGHYTWAGMPSTLCLIDAPVSTMTLQPPAISMGGRGKLAAHVWMWGSHPVDKDHKELLGGNPQCICLPSVAAADAAAKSLQSFPTLCNPIDSSPPGSPFSGIL